MSTIYGNNSNNLLKGTNYIDNIYGYGGNDSLYGYNGNDYLDGGTGIDKMYGGINNDTYIVNTTDDSIYENYNEGIDKIRSSVSYSLSANVENLTLTGYNNINGYGNKLNNLLYGNDKNNILNGDDGNDTIYGNGGNDTLNGGIDADQIYGGTGNDKLHGGLGADTIVGGKGNDYIYGGDDPGYNTDEVPDYWGFPTDNALNTYIFNRGDGQDLIKYANNDTLVFGSGITKGNLLFSETLSIEDKGSVTQIIPNLVIKIQNTNDAITLFKYKYDLGEFQQPSNINLKFSDESTLNKDQIIDLFTTKIYGTNYNDTLDGSTKNNVIYSYAGNDKIYDPGGNDYINSGNGNNYIYDEMGSDTIYAENGNDTIYSDQAVGWNTIGLIGGTNDFINAGAGNDSISDNEGKDTVYGGSGNDTIYDNPGVDQTPYDDSLFGNSGDDKIYSCNGNDTIYGDTGNDYIKDLDGNNVITGGIGNDTIISSSMGWWEWITDNDIYSFNKGDGKDWYQDHGGIDTIKFGSGIAKSNLHFAQSGDNLLITFNNSSDSITLDNWFQNSAYYIENFDFSNNTHFTASEINALL